MKTYQFTFMGRQPFKDYYLTVTAENFELAREAVFAQFGDKFAMQYPDENFKPEYFPRGQLAHILVKDEGLYTILTKEL